MNGSLYRALAIFRAMALGVLRDRGALLMSFALPAVFFTIMAEVFTATTAQSLRLKLALLDEVRDDTSARLWRALADSPRLDVTHFDPDEAAELRAAVAAGGVDIGLILRGDADRIDAPSGFGAPPLELVADPARAVAVPVLTAELRRAYFGGLPDVAMANVIDELENQFLTLTQAQRREVREGIDEMRADAAAGRETGWSFESMLTVSNVVGGEAINLVAYSAGAVAFMFLLFASVHGAISLLEEQESGILDRVLAGPGGIDVLVTGKFVFVVLQGLVQLVVIFTVAALAYDVDVVGRLGGWLMVSVSAAVCASGLAMLLATACRTRRQAQTIANTAILVLSALGGSMVPRFLMPETFQTLGWLTPNTWALEAYSAVMWRDAPLAEAALPCFVLLSSGLLGWRAALLLARRRSYG